MTATNQLIVWRDSVCAGDDCDAPHELALSVRDESLRSVVNRLIEAHYLASIMGGKATWILQNEKRGGQPLAVLAQQWAEPRFLVEAEVDVLTYVRRDAMPHLYLRYCCQIDPAQAFGCLQRGEPVLD